MVKQISSCLPILSQRTENPFYFYILQIHRTKTAMPGLIVKKLQEDESMSEDDYDSDADDDDDDDDKNACAIEERLANIERMHKQIWLVIETKAKDKGINITEILAQFPVGLSASHELGPTPTQESSIEEQLTNFEMKWRHTLLVIEVVFKAMGTDGTEILAKLAEVRASLSRSDEHAPTPTPTTDAPTQVVEDVVADQKTVLNDTTVDIGISLPDSTFSPPTLAPVVSAVDVPPVFIGSNAATTADAPNSAVYPAPASFAPGITTAAGSISTLVIPPAEAGDTPMPDAAARGSSLHRT
ncbi:uncharacterized protein LOC107770280 isoform X1 [Nicotiana tabacum]|uniref:Uncharacterized protein LOC107770280 isoform X1 n=1 Tax=Nicotiana tabacum TaxID=4097 RepID=A0A1S3XZC7_TOBAC|nr:uncharacterized protein LOC104099970 [Nicotiana tomentosiformis]XP_016445057.1 PREDICTED: uncharacterized protein LOC107770280 [Nicotiana tabacum]